MTEHLIYIQSVIDKALDYQHNYSNGLQAPDVWVPEEMIDRTKHSPYEGIVFWKPVPADISKERLIEFENEIGFTLPDTYKDFLSYKFFIELNFRHEADFFPHTPSFIEQYIKSFSEGEMEETLHRGLIPFARETDHGFFCFDTNIAAKDNEYKIVTYDPEFGAHEYPSLRGQSTFIDLVKELEIRLEQWKQGKVTGA